MIRATVWLIIAEVSVLGLMLTSQAREIERQNVERRQMVRQVTFRQN